MSALKNPSLWLALGTTVLFAASMFALFTYVAPLLGEGRLVRLLGDYHFDPGPFGPSIHVLYPGHRRNTRKVRAFLEHLRASLQRQGLCHRL